MTHPNQPSLAAMVASILANSQSSVAHMEPNLLPGRSHSELKVNHGLIGPPPKPGTFANAHTKFRPTKRVDATKTTISPSLHSARVKGDSHRILKRIASNDTLCSQSRPKRRCLEPRQPKLYQGMIRLPKPINAMSNDKNNAGKGSINHPSGLKDRSRSTKMAAGSDPTLSQSASHHRQLSKSSRAQQKRKRPKQLSPTELKRAGLTPQTLVQVTKDMMSTANPDTIALANHYFAAMPVERQRYFSSRRIPQHCVFFRDAAYRMLSERTTQR
jgi:hypothetical protein